MNPDSRILVTGASGLAGVCLRRYLANAGCVRVFSMDVAAVAEGEEWFAGSVCDPDAVERVLRATRPEYVFHFAGLLGNGKMEELRNVNVGGTRTLLDAMTGLRMSSVKVLVTSSSAVYGDKGRLPVTEDMSLCGTSNYAVTKREQEECALSYVSRGIDVVVTRAFNNIAPGERESMFVSRIAVQIAKIERGEQELLEIGPLFSYRDYLDTRDLVEAYALIADRGLPGEVYNVCSGEAVLIEELFTVLLGSAKKKIDYRIVDYDQSGNIPYQVGDASKLMAETGWRKKRDVRKTVIEILDFWRERLYGKRPADS